MESFEFLGGRYNRPEQIMAGPVQAFRAQNAANGRTVFIHRVSTTEAPAEQAALLKLLTTALVKSADAKRMVLDFGEESGYWYVVTENEPQCALLREWLQIEIDVAAGGSAKPAPPPLAPAPQKSSGEEPNPGEFTKFLKGRAPLPPPPAAPPPPPKAEPNVGEFTRVFGAQRDPQPPPAVPPPAGKPNQPVAPGEFTDFFNATDEERKQIKQFSSGTPQPPPLAQPPANSASQAKPPASEPGEFTRFFKPGLPPMPSKPGPKVPQTLNFQPTQQDNPNVQRPKTAPVNFPALSASKPPDKGEFTQLFSRPDNAQAPAKPPAANYQSAPPVRSDPLGFVKQPSGQPNDLAEDLFNNKIDIPSPTPSSKPQQSEFTRMFGSAGASSPPVQKQSVVAPPRENSLLEEPDAKNTQRLAIPNLSSTPPENKEQPGNSPSEFTRIMQGGYGPAKSAGSPASPPAGGAAPHAGGSGSPLLNVHVSPINPASALPHLGSAGGSLGSAHASASQHGASVGTPLGSASAYGPHVPQMHVPSPSFGVPGPSAKSGNKKLIIFFVVIGVLAVLLVLLMLFVMKNK